MKIYNVIDVGSGGNNDVLYSTENEGMADIYCAYLNTLRLKHSIYEVKLSVLDDMRVRFLFYPDTEEFNVADPKTFNVEVVSVNDDCPYDELDYCVSVKATTLKDAIKIIKARND